MSDGHLYELTWADGALLGSPTQFGQICPKPHLTAGSSCAHLHGGTSGNGVGRATLVASLVVIVCTSLVSTHGERSSCTVRPNPLRGSGVHRLVVVVVGAGSTSAHLATGDGRRQGNDRLPRSAVSARQ